MLVSDARAIVRLFARNAQDTSMYSDFQIDIAMQTVCDEFVRRTACTKTTSTLALTSGSAALPALPGGFLSDALISAYLSGSNVVVSGGWTFSPYLMEGARAYSAAPQSATLSVIGYQQIVDLQASDARTSQPQAVGFSGTTAGTVYPTPDQNYTLNLLWVEPFTTWTAGGSGSTVLNIPDRFLRNVLTLGVSAWMQQNEPENQYAAASLAKYERYVLSVVNAGSLGAREVISTRGVR